MPPPPLTALLLVTLPLLTAGAAPAAAPVAALGPARSAAVAAIDAGSTRAVPAGGEADAGGRAVPLGQPWLLPVDGGVVHRFVVGPYPWSPGHRGVDLRSATGEEVRAPAPGRVTFAGPVAGRGVVVVTHDSGLRSSFEPVDGAVLGASVGRGAVVGRISAGAGHCAPPPCLHWGVRRGSVYLDPLALVRPPAPVVLLPAPPVS